MTHSLTEVKHTVHYKLLLCEWLWYKLRFPRLSGTHNYNTDFPNCLLELVTRIRNSLTILIYYDLL